MMEFWLDYVPLIVAIGALAGVFLPKIIKTETKTDTHQVTEVVDAPVLEQFKDIMTRMTNLEKDLALTKLALAETRVELAAAIASMEEMQKVETFLQDALLKKEKEIIALRVRERELKTKLDENSARWDRMMQERD